MPTYDYRCKACGHEFELFQSMKDKPKRACPSCGKKTLERLIGTGAALLFKGSGFYQTDYRSESYRKSAEADKPATETKPAEAKTAESKPGAKAPESKSEGSKATPATPAKAAEPKPEPKSSKSAGRSARKR